MCKNEISLLHKEIDLVQACITRMAHNSFFIKGWTISLAAIVLALCVKTDAPLQIVAILLIPMIGFWYLDAFFLQTEKKYRKMYDWVLLKRRVGDDELQYDLNPDRFDEEVDSRWKVMWSVTLRWFYGIPIILILLIMITYMVMPNMLQDTRSQIEPTRTSPTITIDTIEIDFM